MEERAAGLRAQRVPFVHARVVRADGSTGWVRGLGRVTYDEDGTPVRIGGSLLHREKSLAWNPAGL